jgi:amino acid transporter
VHGVGALFSAAYGNVGSSIYYALGVVAVFALGLTPVTFVIAGLIFAFTAATYIEATVMYPEAGGSASFARHAFNELVSFFAAWGQMLNYIITVAISAFFVPHYLAVFWDPLGESPGDIIAGIVLIAFLAALNVKGTKESARFNLVLAIADLLTQIVLVAIGIALVLNADTLVDNVHFGVAPTWGDFALGIAVGMIAYTGIETISNMAEEARDAGRTVPQGTGLTVLAVLGLYVLLPVIALSAMPVTQDAAGNFSTELGTKFADDPVLGIVENLGLSAGLTDALRIYVGILAAVILTIATNAALIGLSRLTFSMGHHRQLPEGLRQVHPRFRTPFVAILVFSAVAAITLLPGETELLATMYSFGAMLSFTVAHVSVIQLRRRFPNRDRPWKPPWNFRAFGVELPLTAILGRRHGAQHPDARDRGDLDGDRADPLPAVPSPSGAARRRDRQGRHPGAARRRGGRVPKRAGRVRGRPVLRGDGRDGGSVGRPAAARDPRPVPDQRSHPPAPGRAARGRGERGAEQGRARQADLRDAGDGTRRSGAAGAGGALHRRRGARDQGGRDRRAADVPQRDAAVRQDARGGARGAAVQGDRRRRAGRRPRRSGGGAADRRGTGVMPAPDRVYRNLTLGFSVVIIAFGLVIVAITVAAGGGPISTGVLLGVLFLGIGGTRLYLAMRTTR